jgi:ADP-ribose pyrophosphatase YjhB (NUDIX family)
MVTPSTPAPPPRRESRLFTIPTPADLRHPRQRATGPAEEGEGPDDAALAVDPTDAVVPQPTPAGAADARQGDRAQPDEPADRTAPEPPRPTPATLPRRTARAQPQPADAQVRIPAPAEPPPQRRMFPNPATLMASGRGSRKVRPGGLRARRLPKVEETSAGGVVLDLTADPPAVALIARHDRRSRLLWSLPKGHVEEGETPEEAALREVMEETGLVGRIVAPLGVIDFWFVVEDKRIHKTVHHFVIEAIGGELSDADLEVEAVEWIPYDQVVRKLAYGDERRLVEKVAQIVPGVR